ncbi:terminase [Glutamicibacter sp. AOP5-A2-7]
MAVTQVPWLPQPDDGTQIALGFDGSDSDDFTAIQAETIDGLTFTPRYGPDRRPTIWNPAEWGGNIPRGEVNAAVDELMERFKVKRFYCDPHDWYSEIGDWSLKYGDEKVFEWNTSRISKMYDEIKRFEVDLKERRLTHDGCPIAGIHFANARKIAKPGQKYVLGKPTQHQKIDVAMARILAHTAASDARVAGWGEETDSRMFCFS